MCVKNSSYMEKTVNYSTQLKNDFQKFLKNQFFDKRKFNIFGSHDTEKSFLLQLFKDKRIKLLENINVSEFLTNHVHKK